MHTNLASFELYNIGMVIGLLEKNYPKIAFPQKINEPL